MKRKAAIFDLDGVLVDTAKYHYLAWKELAVGLGFDLTAQQNERLKGVSRMESLEILLQIGGMQGRFTPEQKRRLAEKKNQRYVAYISRIDRSELLDGARQLLDSLRRRHVLIALGSASKNAPLILKNTGIAACFDAVVDGNRLTRPKPDPQVFLLAAADLGAAPEMCAVFEDSQSGLVAAKRAGMLAVGIGRPENLPAADVTFARLSDFPAEDFF